MEDVDEEQTKVAPKNRKRSQFWDLIMPIIGGISYETFSQHIMVPKKFMALFGDRQTVAADILWFNAHIGIGIYLYRHEVFHSATTSWRITYCVFCSSLFNFGSVLMWGASRVLLPKAAEGLKAIFGLGSGLALLFIGWHLTEFLKKR